MKASCVMKTKCYAGFTLIEMAVVLIIVSLLLGSILAPISTQVKNSQHKQTTVQLEVIKEALMGYFLANQRFPCPATVDSKGEEILAIDHDVTGKCGNGNNNDHYGFVPYYTLSLNGKTNTDALLVDTWDNPIIYGFWSENTDCGTADAWTFTKKEGVKDTKINCVTGSLEICTDHSCSVYLTKYAAVVLLSIGKNGNTAKSENKNEYENIGRQVLSLGGKTYFLPNNKQFVSARYNPSEKDSESATRFDDIITWISPYVLYNRLVTAGVYP